MRNSIPHMVKKLSRGLMVFDFFGSASNAFATDIFEPTRSIFIRFAIFSVCDCLTWVASCERVGHSPRIFQQSYLLVTEDDFAKAAGSNVVETGAKIFNPQIVAAIRQAGINVVPPKSESSGDNIAAAVSLAFAKISRETASAV